jgi:YbbR domain-containing protein
MSKEKNNITIKVFALLIAILLWNIVMNKENPELPREIRNIPVSYSNTSNLDRLGLVIMEPKEITANVKVKGRINDMSDFSAKNIVVKIDLSGYSEGQVRVPVTVSLINQKSSIAVTDWEPKEVLFTFDKVITKDIPIDIQVEGQLAENYLLGDVTSKSQFISIRGPRTWVNEVNRVVSSVDINGITEDAVRTRPVQILDGQGNEVLGVDKIPSVIDINVSVLKTNAIPIELITENELPENFTITNIEISPRTVSIKSKGNISKIEKINTKPIDINSLLEQTSMEVELDLPEGVELLNPREKTIITYTIEETIVKDFNILIKDAVLKNLDSTMSIEPLDLEKQLTVSLKGIKSVIDLISLENLVVEIDLLGLEEGTHSVQAKVGNIQGVKVDAIKPEPLDIRLIKN